MHANFNSASRSWTSTLYCIILKRIKLSLLKTSAYAGVVAGGGGVNNVFLAHQSDRSYVRRYPYIPTLLSGKLAHFIFFFFFFRGGEGGKGFGGIQFITQRCDCHAFGNTDDSMECRLKCLKHVIASGAKKHILKTTLPHKNSPRINRLIQNLWSWCHFTREKKLYPMK